MRYGIVGTGMMGCEHIMNIALLEDAEVVAYSDPSDVTRAWGENFSKGKAEAFDNHSEMLDAVELDAIVVASPNHTHKAILDDLLGRDLHILCEKPLCTNADDAFEIATRAAGHPGIFWVAMEYRYMLAIDALITQLREGAVGDLKMVAIREHRYPFLPKVGDWNRFAENTGGTLVEKCCHFFDLMNCFVGADPVRVYASGAQDVNHLDEVYGGRTPDIIDNAFAIVDYANGVRAMLDLCMFAEHSPNEVEIALTGSEGKLEAHMPASRLISTRRDRPGNRVEDFELAPELQSAGAHLGSTYYEHVAFANAIRHETPPEVSAWDGAVAVAIGAAAEESARTRDPVEIDLSKRKN
ncbi:MAG: oxidoreductase [Acidobacteria bacterium]|nr:MAG: oxidoreductase [Acidobacteriota bacterium]